MNQKHPQLRVQKFILVVILLGSTVATLAGRDRWYPFSNYPMYASVFPPVPYVSHYIRLVDADGTETPLQVRPVLWPFWQVAFAEALLSPNDDAKIEKKMRAALKWYNRNLQLQKREPAAPAIALRLYRDETSWSQLVERSIREEKKFEALKHPNETLRLEVKL